MFNLEEALKLITRQTVLCVGDLMLDDFVYGEVSRISPEAPAPVITVNRSEMVIGGAGNVARNIASLGARCIFVGVVGEDGGEAPPTGITHPQNRGDRLGHQGRVGQRRELHQPDTIGVRVYQTFALREVTTPNTH